VKPTQGAFIILAALAALFAQPASAHVVLTQTEAEAQSYYVATFRIGHGCDASPTVAFRVEIPVGVLIARPQPKPGWEVVIEREPMREPVPSEGRPLTERVSAITWRGRLPADQFDEFAVMVKLPNMEGPLYFPSVQSCEQGVRAWTQIPAAGQAWHDVESPAPMVNLFGMDHSVHMH